MSNSRNLGGEMAGYLTRNSDTVLSKNNYNEMDALVFAELSYMEFECVGRWPSKEMTVQQYAETIYNSGVEKNPDKLAFLRELQSCDRYKNCKVPVDKLQCSRDDTQWAAITVKVDQNTSVVAVRGTDGTEQGWAEDFQLAYDIDGTRAQQLTNDYIESSSGNILLTGHSKGGNDVIAGYVMSDTSTRNRVIHIDNFDGPGLNREFISRYGFNQGYSELDNKLTSYYPENSIIGQVLKDPPGESVFIKADRDGHIENMWILGDHDPFSWKVNNGQLERGEQSEMSKSIEWVLDSSMAGLTNRERKHLVSLLIGLQIPRMIAREELDGEELLRNISTLDINSAREAWALWRFLGSLIIAGVIVISWNEFRQLYKAIKKLIESLGESAHDASLRSRKARRKAAGKKVGSSSGRKATLDINIAAVKADCGNIVSISKNLKVLQSEVMELTAALSVEDSVNAILKSKLTKVSEGIGKDAKKLGKIGEAGLECMQLYSSTEKTIVGVAGN